MEFQSRMVHVQTVGDAAEAWRWWVTVGRLGRAGGAANVLRSLRTWWRAQSVMVQDRWRWALDGSERELWARFVE